MTEDQKRKLEGQLWKIADELRGKMNADEFRDYILGFIFYKYLSEKMHLHADKILEQDDIAYLDVDEDSEDGRAILEAVKADSVETLGFFLKPSELFSQIAKRGNRDNDEEGESNFILGDLSDILANIEKSTMGTDSEDDFDKLFEDLDLTSSKLGKSENQKNELIAKVLAHLDKIDFELEDTESDVLGDAYEYLIGKFASGAGKKAGEFYTPQQVSTVLARLVTTGKTRLKSVYDPTCGSGSLLLRVAREVDEVGTFYGQELNRTTYNLARMNMILHDVHYRQFDLKQEDTLEHPQHEEERFEAIVANPPFSAKWSARELFKGDDRFSQYGKLAPKTKADFAFVQHMIHHLDENGQMAVVLPHGVLFRGAAEAHIRRYIIEELNVLDAVIGLPPNLFYGTSIPTCILVLKKCRENPNDILFIDASGEGNFEKVGNQNELRQDDIDEIVDTYRNRQTKDRYSFIAEMNLVVENEYNLNIPRYVDTFEPKPAIDLRAVAKELRTLDASISSANETIATYCSDLGIETPFGAEIEA